MSVITKLKAREILDSRGNPTVEVELSTNLTTQIAAAPSGASTGKHEVVELRDKSKRYLGLGVQKAVRNVEKKIFPLIRGIDCTRQRVIDDLMIGKDNTINKSKLGANAILPVSLATAKVAAFDHEIYLFEYLNELLALNRKMKIPRLFFNIINGGKHAGNKLGFQELMISPKSTSIKESLRIASEIYHTLKVVLEKKYGKSAINVGDEGGFAPPISKAEEALNLIKQAAIKAGHWRKIDLAIDAAASEFYSKGKYHLHKQFTKEQLLKYYLTLIKKYPIISLEDPFQQEDFTSFSKLAEKTKTQIVGDDLTVTNLDRLKKAVDQKSCDCLLLKVNQIGTLSEALDAVRFAYRHKLGVMVSHRSGETGDTFICDLAVGIGCGMIKAGAPCRGERISKYNHLLKIEEVLR